LIKRNQRAPSYLRTSAAGRPHTQLEISIAFRGVHRALNVPTLSNKISDVASDGIAERTERQRGVPSEPSPTFQRKQGRYRDIQLPLPLRLV